MQSLKEVYQSLVSFEKNASPAAANEAPRELSEEEKLAYEQARDYDFIGRVLARHVWDDLVKQAQAEAAAWVGHGQGKIHADGDACPPECAGRRSTEKTAALKQQILSRMAQDPNYVMELLAKHRAALS